MIYIVRDSYMDEITVLLIIIFVLLIAGFIAGAFFAPELFGISKKSDSDDEGKSP